MVTVAKDFAQKHRPAERRPGISLNFTGKVFYDKRNWSKHARCGANVGTVIRCRRDSRIRICKGLGKRARRTRSKPCCASRR